MTKWEYLVVPLQEAGGIKRGSAAVRPDRLNELGSQGWEAVGLTLKRGDLVAWPVVLLKRPVGAAAVGGEQLSDGGSADRVGTDP
jgi:hypothetical protein